MCGKKFLIAVVLGLALALSPYYCYAGEATDTGKLYLTQVEYERLTSNLEELSRLNRTSKTALTTSNRELEEANKQLMKLQVELKTLDSQCQTLKLQTIEQENLLRTANESLERYMQEERRTRLRIKRQRNLAYFALGCMAIAYIRK